jgi:hypothetical protein
MTFDRHEDERPSDERPNAERSGEEPEGIHYFDFSDPLDPSEEDTDPFASETSLESPSSRSASGSASLSPAQQEEHESPFRDVFEFALTGLPSASPSAHDGPPESSDYAKSAEAPSVSFSPLASLLETEGRLAKRRERFAEVFDGARANTARPFLAIALRLESGEAAAHFPTVERGIREGLEPGDVLLAAPDQRRLAVVLPGRGADAARPLFARLMRHLREHVSDADEVGRGIAVLVAPDGRPFQRAADFLAATFDAP